MEESDDDGADDLKDESIEVEYVQYNGKLF